VTGQAFVAVAALVAVLAVLWMVVADHLKSLTDEGPVGPVVIDEAGRLVESEFVAGGRHRARGWWSW
jgi:hypothetical protein